MKLGSTPLLAEERVAEHALRPRGFQTAISSQLSDRPTHLLTDRMTDRPTDLPTYPPTDRPNDRTTDGGVAMTEDRRCRWLCGTDRRTRRHSHLGLHVLALDIWSDI